MNTFLKLVLFIVCVTLWGSLNSVPFACAWTCPEDPLVTEIQKQPLVYYRQWIERKAKFGSEFSFPELRNTVSCVIEDLKDKLPQAYGSEPKVLLGLLERLNGVSTRYPYSTTINLIWESVRVMDYLSYRKKISPLKGVLESKWNSYSHFRESIKRIFPYSSFAIYEPSLSLENVMDAEMNQFLRSEGASFPQKMKGGWDHDESFYDLLSEDYSILFPTYANLGVDFFVDLAFVPIYAVGLIDHSSEELWADGNFMSRKRFFMHDITCHSKYLFKSVSINREEHPPKVSGDPQLEIPKIEYPMGTNFISRYNFRTLPIDQFLKKVDQLHLETKSLKPYLEALQRRDPVLREALRYSLFSLYHEIAGVEPNTFARLQLPVLTDFVTRLRYQINQHFYGSAEAVVVSPEVTAQLERSALWLHFLLTRIREGQAPGPVEYSHHIFPMLEKTDPIFKILPRFWEVATFVDFNNGTGTKSLSNVAALSAYLKSNPRLFERALDYLSQTAHDPAYLDPNWISQGRFVSTTAKLLFLRALKTHSVLLRHRLIQYGGDDCGGDSDLDYPDACVAALEQEGKLAQVRDILVEATQNSRTYGFESFPIFYSRRSGAFSMSPRLQEALEFKWGTPWGNTHWRGKAKLLEIPLESLIEFEGVGDLVKYLAGNLDSKLAHKLSRLEGIPIRAVD